MIPVEYTITHNILNNILSLERYYLKIHTKKNLKPVLVKLQSEALQINLQALTKSIQLQSTSKEMLNLFAGKILPINLGKLKIISNYKNACDYINSLKLNKTTIITLETVYHLNKVLGQDLFELWDLGKVRIDSSSVENKFDPWLINYNNTTLSNNIRQSLPQYFHNFLSETTKMNGILQASLLMTILLLTYPFVTLNQLTILVTLQTVLEVKNYNKQQLWPYFDILEDIQKDLHLLVTKKLINMHTHSILNITDICELIIYHLSKSMYRLYQTIQSDQNLKFTQLQGIIKILNNRQKIIIRYLAHNKSITTAIYHQKTGATAMSASRDFRELIKYNLIKRHGKGRGVYYTNNNVEDDNNHLATSVEDDTLSVYEDKYLTEIRSLRELNN